MLNSECIQDNLNRQKDTVLQELRTFLCGATHLAKVRNVEVARSAIYLLKTLPAARDAVLEHMYNLFDETVNSYILNNRLEDRPVIDTDNDVIEEIHSLLSEFVRNRPEAWAPIISTWALDLLGHLSSKYADRCIAQHASNLPEVLQFWMACKPTRVLIDMTTQCLSTVIGTNPDMCIDALLETSVQHSPHFDWVVAHIGSCFPTTVVTRVLACGLKAFCLPQDGSDNLSTSSGKHVSKMASVVGILGHLAAHHSHDIRKALLSLFHDSFVENPTREQLATVPFLLQLASMSEMLSHVITSEFVSVVTPEMLQKLSWQINRWKSSQIPGTDSLIELVLHLLLKSDEGSQVIKCLLNIVNPLQASSFDKTIQDAAGWILDSVLLQIQHRVHGSSVDIPILQSFKVHISDFSSCLKERAGSTANWILNILKFMCIHGGDKMTADVLGHLLCNISEVIYIRQLLVHVELTHPHVWFTTVSDQMAELKCAQIKEPVQLIKNLINLIKIRDGSIKTIEAIQPHMEILAGQVISIDNDYADAVIELLSLSVIPERMTMSSLLRVSSAVVGYFFKILSKKNINNKLKMLQISQNLLVNLCQQSATQHMVLRMLLEASLDNNSHNFGSKCVSTIINGKLAADYSLLKENRQYITSITLPQNHSSVFHAGVIGFGLRTPVMFNIASKDETVLNRQVLLDTIQACCVQSWRFPLDKAASTNKSNICDMKTVALLMVELISPDVMFNGLPWPDEDFLKVTIERDLHIKRMFDEHPILWDLLFLIASSHPSLCYCSVLLRAIMAVLITHWGSYQERKTSNSPKQLEITQKLIDVMALGQILPPPLAYISEILPSLTPFEAFCLLSDTWQYMKDNVPSPALFTVTNNGRMWRDFAQNTNENKLEQSGKIICDKKYTDRLRFILQANIEKFGCVYAKFFPC